MQRAEADIKRLADTGIGGTTTNIGGGYSSGNRLLFESKAVQGLKIMGANKKLYREWNEKFCNTIGAVMPGMREILQWVRMRKDNPVTFVDYESAYSSDTSTPLFSIRWERANEALYSVLMEKTEGEAQDRVKGVLAVSYTHLTLPTNREV